MAALRSSQHSHRNHQPVNINHHHHQLIIIIKNLHQNHHTKRHHPCDLPPLYQMSRGIKTIRLWSDNGGVKWGEDQKERKVFNRRRSIITIIDNLAQQYNTTIETAADVTEERCSRLNKPLYHLAKHDEQIFE
ncbi:hypothetical protein [Absidia glauca]|uniref:Transcription activator GCR1-like domain-containing protein n=1 Tax=Absidia glauca TaxID=4829 RepID=A0A168S1M9_ABSGL|nr:hypothetical protein [Absidia glauca]